VNDGQANASDNPRQAGGYVGRVLRWIGAIGIATIAVMRCLIAFTPQVVFDVDPALFPGAFGGLGPAGSLWLDVVLFLFAACGFAGEALSRRSIDWLLVLFALIPIPIVLWHGGHDAGDLWRGATWAAAAVACAAVAHLARDRALRIVLIMSLVAVIAPLLARGAANVLYEHGATVEQFEQQKEQIFAEKGWAPDSAAARIYERRLRQNQPTAWFVSTNVFGSMMAFGLVAWLGLAIAAGRGRLESGVTGLLALIALAAAAGLWLTGSSGAMLAALGGLVLLLAPLISEGLRRLLERFGPIIAVLCIAGALLGVVARGMAPEGLAGEKSLLFRWHYMVSSAHIIADEPLLGVGPDGYQAAYVKHRVPRNPEEVAGAHSVFLDWLCALGIGGAAWIVMTIVLLWRAGGALRMKSTDEERAPPINVGRAMGAVSIIALLGLLPAIAIEWHVLDPLGLAVRFIGLAGFVILALALGHALARGEAALINWLLAAAVIALLVHGQIEMTFTRPGPAVWAMCAVGLAGGARGDRPPSLGLAAAILLLCISMWILFTGALPASRQQARMIEAAAVLWPLAEMDAGGIDPAEEVARRVQAAEMLLEAQEALDTANEPRLAAGEQVERASWRARGPQRIELLDRALTDLQPLIDERASGRAIVLAGYIHRRLAELTGDEAHQAAAVKSAQSMVVQDPHGLSSWKRLGDVLWDSGGRAEAMAAYRRALQINADFELDPVKQLTDGERAEIERRVGEAR
jgi:hypothetical protein